MSHSNLSIWLKMHKKALIWKLHSIYSYSPTQKCQILKTVHRNLYSKTYGQRRELENCPTKFVANQKKYILYTKKLFAIFKKS